MVEHRYVLPVCFRVATVAATTLLSGVNVIVEMAGFAGRSGRRGKNRLDMTVDAANFPMRSAKEEPCVPVVIEARGSPRIIVVAVPAVCRVMSVMVVVIEMAGDAGRVEAVGKRIAAVTTVTCQARMAPQQFEICIAGVIETRVRPVERTVTILASFSTAAIMRVIFCMAAEARLWRTLEGLIFMAVETGHICVLANERIAD